MHYFHSNQPKLDLNSCTRLTFVAT